MPNTEPRYQALRRRIQTRIRTGEWTTGDRIPSERELAREAGVSQMTVNRALGDLVRAGVLVRRVGSGTFVADRTAVVPSRLGIVVATKLTSHPEEDIYLRTPFAAISSIAARVGCQLIVSQIEETDLPALVDEHPDMGLLVLAPREKSYDVLHGLYDAGVRFVVMGASWPDAPFACVDSDNVGGVQTSVSYLVRLGHRRIAFINGDLAATNCRDRLAGYLAGLHVHGIEPEPDWMIRAVSSAELGPEAMRQVTELLIGRHPVTAVVCAGYMLTLSLFTLLNQLQMVVPDDVSVVGFDDQPSAEHLRPPLTTVRQPLYALGERAAQRTLDLLRSPGTDGGGVEKLSVDLVVRASCRRV
jgi:DNA-binding LacI/PurR family transcriptional regulator